MSDAGEAVRPVGATTPGSLHLQIVAGGEGPLSRAGDDANPQVVTRGEDGAGVVETVVQWLAGDLG